MKYLITGGSGYIGSRLVELLSGRDETERIVITDIRAPRVPRQKTSFVRMDIRDRAMHDLLAAENPDALVHLAFVLNPIHDEQRMYDIDVNGTQNVLDAAATSRVPHVLVASSTTAYGAWPDNPIPLTEEHPVRAMPNYEYARDKTEIDRMCQLWAAQHPDRVMTIVRPCIVFGPNVDNYIVRFWENAPFMALIGGVDMDFQYVHEDDVVDALSRLLDGSTAGIYNLTGDGTVKLSEAAGLLGLKIRRVPFRLFRWITSVSWRLRLPRAEAPPGQLDFLRFPWIASNERIKAALDWQPRHSSRETFEATLRARGKLPAASPVGSREPAPLSG